MSEMTTVDIWSLPLPDAFAVARRFRKMAAFVFGCRVYATDGWLALRSDMKPADLPHGFRCTANWPPTPMATIEAVTDHPGWRNVGEPLELDGCPGALDPVKCCICHGDGRQFNGEPCGWCDGQGQTLPPLPFVETRTCDGTVWQVEADRAEALRMMGASDLRGHREDAKRPAYIRFEAPGCLGIVCCKHYHPDERT